MKWGRTGSFWGIAVLALPFSSGCARAVLPSHYMISAKGSLAAAQASKMSAPMIEAAPSSPWLATARVIAVHQLCDAEQLPFVLRTGRSAVSVVFRSWRINYEAPEPGARWDAILVIGPDDTKLILWSGRKREEISLSLSDRVEQLSTLKKNADRFIGAPYVLPMHISPHARFDTCIEIFRDALAAGWSQFYLETEYSTAVDVLNGFPKEESTR